MKKNSLITAFIALALVTTSCSLPFKVVPASNDVPLEEVRPEENRPPEEVRPEENRPPEEVRPEENRPPEEVPPEQAGEAQIAFFLAHRTEIRSGECTPLEWGVQGAAEVTLNGERVDQGGVREVCPQATTNYRLTVRAGEQVQEREVTVNVVQENQGNPPPPPQPQPTQKPAQKPAPTKKGPTPTPTFLVVQFYFLDLGVNQIYSAASGKIMIRIRNAGTQDVKNNIKVSCQAKVIKPNGQDSYPPPQNKTITINLAPGQTADYETGYARDPQMKELYVSCKITPPANDANSGNNALNNIKVK
ncbi:MAG: hypothetical protein JW730_11105 [Anaerolineales bacterium]|nr:hypothetical protein [Anaerolineales bacterium]